MNAAGLGPVATSVDFPLLGADDFRRNGRQFATPFRIRLLRNGAPCEVRCVELYRVLPGRRVVVRAELEGRQVLLKLFFGARAARYRQREERGLTAILSCGVLAPAVLGGGQLDGGNGEWFALEFVAQARALSERDLADNHSRAAVLHTLARLHEGGVAQHDLHLGNFLVTNGGALYTIDGGAVRSDARRPLGHRRSVANLALFFAQFPRRQDHYVAEACRTYAAARRWPIQRVDAMAVAALVDRARERRVQRYLRKSLRECTEFHSEVGFTRFVVAERAALASGLDELLDDLDARTEQSPRLKAGRTATVVEVGSRHEAFVVKRYNIKSLGHALTRLFRPTRAHHAWLNAQRLRFLGISDARPRALVERRLLRWLRRDAYLVMAKVEGSDLLRHAAMPGGCSDAVVNAVVRLFADLQQLRLVHGDTKATNFIVTKDAVVLIDLDSMRRVSGRAAFDRRFENDLDRFLDNFVALPDVHARFRDALAPLRVRSR